MMTGRGATRIQKDLSTEHQSDLTRIKVSSDSPFQLFQEWYEEARRSNLVLPQSLTLATSARGGLPSARTVLLRRLDEDGFVVATDRRSRKVQEMTEVPSAAMVFLWNYLQDGNTVNRQVRVEGPAVQLEPPQYRDLYDREPLYCKVRSHLCRQGVAVDWQEHKDAHEQLLERWRTGQTDLAMPGHFVAFKLVATSLEFYCALGNTIGDRVLFTLDDGTWRHHNLAA